MYRHPNGFVVCRIEQAMFTNWQIRIHLWPASFAFTSGLDAGGAEVPSVHSHGWDLLSKVVAGEMEDSTYEVAVDPMGSKALFTVESDYGVGSSRLKPFESAVTMTEVAKVRRTAVSGSFDIPAGRFHASRPLAQLPSATVVATSTQRVKPCEVVRPRGGQDLVGRSREPVSNLPELVEGVEATYEAEKGGSDKWAAFAFIVDTAGRVLMLRSHRRPGLWQPPGGRSVTGDRNPYETLCRELREEVGLDVGLHALSELGSTRRDLGDGDLHFWRIDVAPSQRIAMDGEELAEMRWVTLQELRRLPKYPATAAFAQLLESSSC